MKRINYHFSRALAMLLCATLLIMNLEMTAFAAAGVTDADSSGIMAEEMMRKPVLPLNQEEKDWIAEGIKNSGLEKVDMSKFAEKESMFLHSLFCVPPYLMAGGSSAQRMKMTLRRPTFIGRR